jgi:hypothetical protein
MSANFAGLKPLFRAFVSMKPRGTHDIHGLGSVCKVKGIVVASGCPLKRLLL